MPGPQRPPRLLRDPQSGTFWPARPRRLPAASGVILSVGLWGTPRACIQAQRLPHPGRDQGAPPGGAPTKPLPLNLLRGGAPGGPSGVSPTPGVQCGSPHPGVSSQGPPGTPGACKGGCRWQGAGQSSHQTDASEELASCHLCGPLPQLRPQRQGLVAESSSEAT